jgi:filamentous hemagglutinin family protein
MNRTASFRRCRALLRLTTAMGTLVAAPALAQTGVRLPTQADVITTTPGNGVQAPDIDSGNGLLDVRLRATNTVIDWNGFNIPAGQRANFRTTLNTPAAVLNRDLSGNGSQLNGALTSGDNIAVWIYNPNGILVGSGARITTGSLVLTTLDVTNFLGGGPSYSLTTSAGSTAGITVVNGAQITVEGGTRGLVMVAPKIDAAGQFTATGQDVAFVTASDVTLTYNIGSPLSVTLNQGTAVTGVSQIVRGTVAGDDALFALASRGNVTDALLQVDASVTTALSGTRGIVLSAGRPAMGVSGVTVAAAGDTVGVARLSVNGALTTLDTNETSDILASASGGATFAGALTTAENVSLSAAGPLTVGGAVTAGNDYRLRGSGITLGNGSPVVQRADGGVSIVSTDGDVVGLTDLTLRSSAAGGSDGLEIGTAGTIAGDIRFAEGTVLIGGTNRSADVTLTRRDTANAVALGDLTARALRSTIGTTDATNGLTVTGALVLGDIDVQQNLSLTAAGVTAGTLRSGGGVMVAATGDIATAGITALNGSVLLTGTGATTLTGTLAASGSNADVTVQRDGAIALGAVNAARDIRIGGATTLSARVGGAVNAGRNYTVNGGDLTLGGTAPVTQQANGAVQMQAGSSITGLAGLTLRANADAQGGDALLLSTALAGGTINFAPATSLIAGGTAQGSDIQIRSADGTGGVTLGNIGGRALRSAVGPDPFATGLIRNAAITVGNVTLGEAVVLTGTSVRTGALTTSVGGATLTGTTDGVTTGDITAPGAVLADAAGALSVDGNVAAGGALTLRGASVLLGGARATSGGAIDILARSGGISSTGALALTSSSSRGADFIRMQAAGPEGISFAPGSAITGGTDRALRVAVFNGTTEAPLALGNVTALSLGALAATDGDATARPGAIVARGNLNFGALDLVDGFAAESTAGNLTVQRIAVSGAGQGISLIAGLGALTVQNDIAASGDVTLTSGTGLTLGTVESRDGTAALSSSGAIRLSRLAGGRAATATGTSLAIDTVVGGAVRLVATTGDVTLANVSGTPIAIDAAGAFNVSGDLRAAGDVTLSGGGAVTLGTVESRTGAASVTSGGAVRLTGLLGALGASATGTGVSIDTVTGGPVRLTATTGDVAAGSIRGTTVAVDAASAITARGAVTGSGALAFNAGGTLNTAGLVSTTAGNIVLAAAGNATIAGGTDAAGDVSIAGSAITLGSAQRAGGAFQATATTAGITGLAGLAITSDTDGTGAEALTLTGPGGISLDRGSQLRGGRDAESLITLTTNGAAVSIGGVTADALGVASTVDPVAAITTGDLTIGAVALQATGGVTTGLIASRGIVAIDGGTGTVATGAITTDGAISLLGGALQFGRVEAASLTGLAATGTLAGADIVTSGAVSLQAGGSLNVGRVSTTLGNVALRSSGDLFAAGVDAGGGAVITTLARGADVVLRDGLTARGDVVVSSGGDIRAPSIRSVAGDLTIAAPNGGIGGFTPGSGIALSVDPARAFSLTVGAAARLGDVRTGTLTINATSISAGSVDTGTSALTLNATAGDLVLTGPVTGGAVSLGASEQLQLAAVTASGALTLTGGTGLSFTDISGAAVVATSGGALTGQEARSGGDLRLTGGTIALGGAFGRDVALASTVGDVVLGTLVATGDSSLSAKGGLRITGNTEAAGALTLGGGTGIAFGNVSGRTITATSVGTITGSNASANEELDVSGAALAIGSASGRNVTLAATAGDATLGTLTATGTGALAASGAARITGLASAAGALTLIAGAGLSVAEITGGSIKATAMGDVSGAAATSAGDIEMTGGSLSLGSVGGRTLALTATSGNAAIGTLTATGDATLGAAGATSITGDAAAAGLLTLSGATSLTFDDIAGGTIVARSAGLIAGKSARAAGDLTASGGALTLTEAAGRNVVLTATGDDVALGTLAAQGDATVSASGATRIAGPATAVGVATLSGGTELRFADLTGGTVALTSGGALVGNLARATGALQATGATVALGTAAGGDVSLKATRGDVAVGALQSTGNASLDAAGALDLAASAQATGILTLTGATGVTFTDISGASIVATSGGAVAGGAARAAGDIRATGAAVSLAQATAGGGLTLAATSSDAMVGTLTSGGTAAVSATSIARITGAVVAGGDYRVTGASVSLGGGTVTQSAAGSVRITSTAGDIAGAAGLTLRSDGDASAGAEPLILDSAGGIALAGTQLQARAGGGAALGLRAGSARAVTLGNIEAGLIGGFDGTRVGGAFTHDGAFTAGNVVASDLGVTLGTGDLAIGRLAATGSVALRAGGITLGDVGAGTLDLAGSRALTTGRVTTTGSTTLAGGSVTTGDVRASTITVRTAGVLGGAGASRPSLTSTGGDVAVEAGTARLASVESAGAVTLAANTIEVTGRMNAARRLLAEARDALTTGDARAGDTLTLRAGGQLNAGSLDAGGVLSATGAGATIGAARTGGALALSSTRDLSLGSGAAAGVATVEATGLASLGGLTAGPSIAVTAGDAALTGPIRAAAVTFTNRAPATSPTHVGDGTTPGGFSLSAAEINQVAADSLRVGAGAGSMEIGAVTLGAATGRQVELLSTGDIRVTGALSAAGTGRAVRIGGDSGTGSAANIHVVSTSGGGGRLLMEGQDVELRGNRIAVGLATGFIDTLVPGEPGRAQAANLLGNANSALYNAQLGGGFFDPAMTTTVAARTLSLRFGDYALIQNTALPGEQSAVVLGGTLAAPVNPALRVSSNGSPATANFALFGTINGVSGASAALLGGTTLDIDPLLLPNSRINGCLAGSGAGCLTTIVIQPTLQVFDWDSEDVFGIIQDVSVPFAPSIGGNNEELLTGLPALAPDAGTEEPAR